MKRFLSTLTLLLCFAFTAVNAQVITAERAAEIANSFFSAGVQKSAVARGVVSSPGLTSSFDSNDVTETASAEPTFYVLANPEGGFVIVSGEETENPIIGYSLDGTIDVDNLPDGFVGYMTDIDAQVKSLREYNANNPQKAAAARSAMQRAANFEYNATSMGNIVKNLNTAPWGQRTPFNNLCKTTDGQTALTGCGPTAFAILCYYYKWPASGVGTVTHQGTGENMELGHTYDYANMRNDNYPSGYSEAEANAIAVLMRDLGWANQVGYGTSSTSFSETGQHMVDHFRFKSERPVDHGASLAVVRSTLGNDTQWKTYIKNNLDAGYPIPYASTTNTSNSARHIYILDGYTDNDYYHFNWGWSGSGNGWFTLDNMVPDDYSNYSNSHKAYFNLIPDATTYTVRATATPSNMGTVSINGGTAGTTVSADLLQGVTATLTAHPAQGYALVSWTKNGVVVGSRTTLQVPVGTDANDYVANFDDEANVIVVQDYTINATSGTELTGDKVQEWAFNRNNDYPAELKLTSTAASINRNGNNIQLHLISPKTSETYTLSVQEGYEITQYTIRCKATSSYNIKVAAEGQEITPTTSYADYKFVRSNTLARTTSNSASFTVTGSTGRYMQVESITVTVAKEGANVPSTPTTYTINVNAETGGNAYVNGTNTSVTVDAGTDVTLQAYPDGTNYTFAGWYNGNSLVSSNNPYTFALNSNVTYTAKFNAVATTCTVTTTANPAAGGTAKFAVGTGSQKIQGDVENGTEITLYAVANTGYNFVNWTLNGTVVGTTETCNVAVSQTANYVANFEAVQQGGSSSINLAGKYFRLKDKGTGNYMTVENTNYVAGTTSIIVSADNSGDAQIFCFEQSGNGYKIKQRNGNYLNCDRWSVHANADHAAVVFTLESTTEELEYLIKWENNNRYDNGSECPDYFKVENSKVYCDAPSTAAATWVLEEVIPSNEKTLDVTFNNATYTKTDGTELTSGWGYQVVTQTTPAVTIKVAETINNFGYTTGVISGVKTPYLYKNTNFILSISEQYKITGYKITVRGQDNSYSGDFTCSVDGNETSKATLSGTTTQTLSATGLDTNIINISVGGTSGNGIFITALEITYVENEFEPLPFKAEIDGWRNDNPNTHLGTITIGGTAMKLTPAHQTASELTMPLAEGTALAFTRKYRGFEFNGFYIGATSLGTNPTLTADNVAAINETTPLVAKFTATDDVTLFYDDDEFSYRIPAIAKTGTNRLVAVSDYRHSHDDIGRDNHKTGTLRVDLVMRTSDDNGLTWSEKQTIAEGTSTFGYGDAAVVANGENILVMAVAGNVFFANANANNKQRTYRIYSSDNGATWNKEEVSNNLYTLFPNGYGMFFGSGKLVVDPNFNNSGNARVYGAVLLNDGNNYVVYSDNWGSTWNILGGGAAASANEPKVEILPNGQILLSARRNGGRTFNVFTYTDKANNSGTWSTATNGCDNGGNGTNGEIICLDAKRPNGKPTKILLQSQPYGSDRRNVSIWYKEIGANETYTASSIASGWTMGKQVSTQLSAYSAMALQENGEIAFFFEEAPCHNDDNTYGYSMVYVPLTIEEITNNNFLNPNADVEYVPVEFNIVLTDAQGNEYRETIDYIPSDVAAVESYLTTTYPFITLGTTGAIADNTYTNTVTLPFKVSNANTTVWHNIYWPANDTSAGKYYPIYLLSTAEGDTYVAKKTETKHYGNSQYNTYNYADKLAWAVYSVNNTLTFKFKNKLTGKFIAVTGVSSDNTNNVVYTDEAGATAFTLEKYTGGNASYGNYAIKSVYNSTTGYVCNTSVGYTYATNYPGTGHAGAWVKFVESPDYWTIYNQLIADIDNFGTGEGKYTANDAISSIDKDALASMPLNSLNTKATAVQTVKDSYTEITLTVPAVNDVVPGSVKILGEEVNHKFVPKGIVTIQAVPAAGYRFVNWTRPAAQASAAARTAEARNSNVVSEQNPYTVTVSEALSLEANFEQIVVNATLTDAQSNTYEVQVSGFTTEITEGTVAAKLTEKYPYITLGTTDVNGNVIDNGVLNINGTAYTYTNNVELPFKVSSVSDATNTYWHNIYYPSNNTVGSKPGCPNYIAAFNNDDDVVDMAASGGCAYGENLTYNTKAGNPMISWAVYSVNNSFEFIFKNELTNNYIKVESVSSSTTNNVKFVENAGDATAFSLLKDATDSYNGDYALVAKTGYLCATSSSTNYVTHFSRTNHQGAWVKFVEVDYGQYIKALDSKLGRFDVGNDKHMITDEIQPMINALVDDYGVNITKSQFEAYFDAIDAMDAENWPKLSLTIAPDNSGTTTIAGEEGVTRKYVPTGDLTINATPAEGYHFVSWTSGTNEVSTDANYTFNITAATELTANFAKNSYTVSVTAGEGGSATASATTVEHGGEVTLTAAENDGYDFAGWYNGETKVSSDAEYTVTNVTSDINYTARFEEEAGETPTTHAIHIVTVDTNGNPLTNNATGPVKAVINIGGRDWVTDEDFGNGATADLVATSDFNQSAYLFDGWYKNGVFVSMKSEITVTVTETATYQARFIKGYVVTLASDNKTEGYPNMITYPDGSPVVGAATELKAVVKPNEEVLISINPNYGFRVANWTDKDGNEVAGKNANSFTLKITGDNKYTAHIERATYTLSVSTQQGTMGEVSAKFMENSGTSVVVGHNQPATITASPYTGYRFVEWTTTDGTHVSDEKTYTVPAIENVEDMVDVEYVAIFEEIEEVEAGTYYRIAYDFEVPVAAKTAATRAAGDVVNIDLTTGTFEGLVSGEGVRTIYSQWLSANGVRIIAEDKNNNEVTAMRSYNGFQLYINSLESLPIKYTIIVPEGYTLTSMKFKNGARTNDMTVVYGSETYSLKNDATEKTITFTEGNTSFTLSGTVITKNILITALTMTENGSETPEPDTETVRYYVQSDAVSGTNNAMIMRSEDDENYNVASSIFYYAGNKLLSYKEGRYLNEGSNNTRGLQNVGVEGGDVEFIENKIKVSSGTTMVYLHANEDNGTYFVDRCTSKTGDDNGDPEHNFIIEEVTSLPVTITDAGYATWYAPVAVQLPEGLTAYTITIHGDYAITGEGFKQVPANTGVILEGTKGTIYELEIIGSAPEVESIMEGTVAATYFPENESAYVLSTDKGTRELGFYMANDGQASWSHKAYLPKSAIPADAQMSAGFRLILPGTTAIEEVETENNIDAIYDLTGRKLEGISGTGIYIINGKKILVK